MSSNRGVALILALLVLSFLAIVGSALVTTATIDIWISDNYKTATQCLYLAESGIEQAREILRTSPSTPTQLLMISAGADGQLQTSYDPATLLASDDPPLLDSSGQAGRYTVWLRNDNGDGITNTTDTNGVLTLVSVGQVGTTRKVSEVVVQKGRFPNLPGIDTQVDPRLTTAAGLESLAASITKNATDVFKPQIGTAQQISDYGTPANYKVAVVTGDVDLGPGTGYGMLLARGNVRVVGNFTWSGLILVIGQGALTWSSGVTGTINGGVFVAPGASADLSPATIFYDTAAIEAANRTFPYSPISIKER